jgi:hypothetical protein
MMMGGGRKREMRLVFRLFNLESKMFFCRGYCWFLHRIIRAVFENFCKYNFRFLRAMNNSFLFACSGAWPKGSDLITSICSFRLQCYGEHGSQLKVE